MNSNYGPPDLEASFDKSSTCEVFVEAMFRGHVTFDHQFLQHGEFSESRHERAGCPRGNDVMKYELAVIGNDEAAFEMLNLAAVSGRRSVAVIPDIRHSGWLVSQALRRLNSDLLVDRTVPRRNVFARAARPRLLQSLLTRSIASELREHIGMLQSLGVDVRIGEARIDAPADHDGALSVYCQSARLVADHVVIATGVRRTALPATSGIERNRDPEWLLAGRRLPRSVSFLGGGDLSAGLAGLLSLFGVETGLIVREENDSVMHELAASAGVEIIHKSTETTSSSEKPGRRPAVDTIVDCRRIVGFTDHLNLKSVNVEPDENGQLWCAGNLETWCPGLFGAGAVVGFSPDSTLPSTVQAERIMGRISRRIPRPHILSRLSRVSA